MSEMSGVYVRLQNTDGVLWSSSRESHAEVIDDLSAAFGEDVARAIVNSLKKGMGGITGPDDPNPVEVSQAEPGVGYERAQAILDQAAMPVEEAPAGQFEPCNVCQTPKDQWKPPGISASGKKYPGFFGCPNFRNHPR